MARCFVASLPPEPTRAALHALARTLQADHPGARPTRAANLHLTLAFIGDLDEAHLHAVATALAALPAPQGTWRIDRLGCFPGARVVWAGGADLPALQAQADDVRARLVAMAVPFDARPFAAHVTLLRGPTRRFVARPLDEPLAWPLARAVLMRSHRVGPTLHYTPVAGS